MVAEEQKRTEEAAKKFYLAFGVLRHYHADADSTATCPRSVPRDGQELKQIFASKRSLGKVAVSEIFSSSLNHRTLMMLNSVLGQVSELPQDVRAFFAEREATKELRELIVGRQALEELVERKYPLAYADYQTWQKNPQKYLQKTGEYRGNIFTAHEIRTALGSVLGLGDDKVTEFMREMRAMKHAGR